MTFSEASIFIKNEIMQLHEILFFGGFVLFVAAVLLVDMLAIDRKAHEVSLKEAGIWTAVWIGLALVFGAFVYFHGDFVHGIKTAADLQAVVSKYGIGIAVDPSDFEGSLRAYRADAAMSYISGYLIEKMLSVDNLFVMMAIFTAFGVAKKEYQHVLDWGIFGAIVLRFVFIFAGAALVNKFTWLLYVFGAVLVYSGWKMWRDRNKKDEVDVGNHPVIKFLSRHFNVFPNFAGDRFFVRAKKTSDGRFELSDRASGGLLCMTPLLVTVIVIELSDIIFACDSIPAVFSVSRDPFIVFFSNIFAVLGLRAMFFLLSAVVDKFRYLKIGVCVLLLFIGFKLLAHGLIDISAELSLGIILGVLAVSVGASLIIKPKATAASPANETKEK